MIKMSFQIIFILIVLILIGFSVFIKMTSITQVEGRWYSQDAVDNGAKLFQQHCASCHGANAEGTREWNKTDNLGNYPPPPLNGTAHAWHHDISILKETIQKGGAELGGTMPPFKDELSDSDIEALIAFIQSKWPYEVYQFWKERYLEDEIPSNGSLKKDTEKSALNINNVVAQYVHYDYRQTKAPVPPAITNCTFEQKKCVSLTIVQSPQ